MRLREGSLLAKWGDRTAIGSCVAYAWSDEVEG